MTKRIQYAVMNGVNTCIITGTGEPLQNIEFLNNLTMLFRDMNYPFPNVELQTTGVFLSEKRKVPTLIKINEDDDFIYPYINVLEHLRVNTISLSVASIFNNKLNSDIIGINSNLDFALDKLIIFLKEKGFNVRLSLNMLKNYNDYGVWQIIERCKELKADQITFRKMYQGMAGSAETEWVSKNKCSYETLEKIKTYIEGTEIGTPGIQTPETIWHFQKGHGEFLYKLPFGGKVYSIKGMSVVMDDDCMSKENNEALKYIILREDGKLYCRWDDNGSLIF
ncbi:MAG: hypothetical protein WC554_14545 [Clostridia bacterium]